MKKSGFLKKFIPIAVIIGIIGIFCLVDFINYKTYNISLVSAYTDENPEGDPTKLYYTDSTNKETIHLKLKVTKNNNPVFNHSIVGIGKNAGDVKAARKKTDEEGIAIFDFVSVRVYEKVESITASVFFYEESSAYVIEFRVENTIDFTLYRRPEVTNEK